MTTTTYSKEELFFTFGLSLSAMSISGTSVPIMYNGGVLSCGEYGTSAVLIEQIKKRGLYSWAQVAKLFGVSKRTAQMWAAGGAIASVHEKALRRVMKQIEAIEEADRPEVRFPFIRLLDQERSHFASTPTDVNRQAPTYVAEN